MPLIQNTYGKGRVRVMRVHRGDRHEVRELTIMTLLDGDFAAAYTEGDNRTVVATDTIKNIAYIVATVSSRTSWRLPSRCTRMTRTRPLP